MFNRMKKTLLITLLTLAAFNAFGDSSQFLGEWEIEIVPVGKDEFPFYRQIKYPKWMVIKKGKEGLNGEYIDQFEYRCNFPLLEELNDGNDLLFVNCGSTKSSIAYSPIHHAKIKDGKLYGVVTTDRKVFEWIGTRVK